MTVKQLRDLVYAKYPDAGQTMVDQFLVEGMRAFCQQTLLGFVAYVYQADGTNTSYLLDSKVLSVDSVWIRDGVDDISGGTQVYKVFPGNKVTTANPTYQVVNGYLSIGPLNDGQASPLEAGKFVHIHCRSAYETLEDALKQYEAYGGNVSQSVWNTITYFWNSITETWDQLAGPGFAGLPAQFHTAFAYYANMMLSGIASDYAGAQYYNSRFQTMVRDGRKFTSRKLDGNLATVPYYY